MRHINPAVRRRSAPAGEGDPIHKYYGLYPRLNTPDNFGHLNCFFWDNSQHIGIPGALIAILLKGKMESVIRKCGSPPSLMSQRNIDRRVEEAVKDAQDKEAPGALVFLICNNKTHNN
jgi:hypothetical protein